MVLFDASPGSTQKVSTPCMSPRAVGVRARALAFAPLHVASAV